MDKKTFLNKFDCKGDGSDGGPKHETSWERFFNPKHRKHKEIGERFEWQTTQLVGPRVIDIGCGSGLGAFLAAQRQDICEIHAVDIWEATLARARKFISQQTIDIQSKIKFTNAWAEKLPFNNNYFDCVIMGEVLEHVYDDIEALNEADRVCKPGGTIILSVPSGGTISANHVRVYDKINFKALIERYFCINFYSKISNWIICKAVKSQ